MLKHARSPSVQIKKCKQLFAGSKLQTAFAGWSALSTTTCPYKMNDTREEARLYVQCGKPHVKVVKTWLENQNALHKGEKIKSIPKDDNAIPHLDNLGCMLVPTTALVSHAFVVRPNGYSTTIQEAERILSSILHINRLPNNIKDAIKARFYLTAMTAPNGGTMEWAGLNELQKAFCDFLHTAAAGRRILTINDGDEKQAELCKKRLHDTAPKRWGLYQPMILLPPGSISSDWMELLKHLSKDEVEDLYQNVLNTFSGRYQFTHIALNKGIPLSNDDAAENTIRAPSSEMARLYGDFGPDIPAKRFYLAPDSDNLIGEDDFKEAFWVCTKQNGLYQFWAPRWTMFSRGNVKEKRRVLGFSDAYSYTKKGKHDAHLAQIRSDMLDAEVVALDSSSLGQSSPEKAKAEAQVKPPPLKDTNHAAAMAPANNVNVTSFQPDILKPFTVESEVVSNKSMAPQDKERLHLDGYASVDPKQLSSRTTKPKHNTFKLPDLGKFEKPKIQEVQLALDLYAGIGYFTLSYLKLGYDVIAYELNPFSVEGLRRGAEANGYDCTVIRGKELLKLTTEEEKRTLAIGGGTDKNNPMVLYGEENDERVIIEEYGSHSRDDAKATDEEVSYANGAMDIGHLTQRARTEEDIPISKITNITKKSSINGISKPSHSIQVRTQPPDLRGPISLQSLETSLQGQFSRPPRVIVYEQSNEHAYKNFIDLSTQHSLNGGNPYKIRHINLGFLPSSSDSWDTAAQLIASNFEGGTVHVHENVHIDHLEKKQAEILGTFDELINPYCYGLPESPLNLAKKRTVRVVHREMVKSYAPSVWHVVFDIKVGPKKIMSGAEKRDRMNDASYYDVVEDVAASSAHEAGIAPPMGYSEMDVNRW